MKSKKNITLILLFIALNNMVAQDNKTTETYGKALNVGLGIGYYGYINHSLPVALINFEFDVAKNFTLAPFIGYYSFRRNYYWGDKYNPNRFYSYKSVVVPIGVKGTYYFDQLLNADSKWDFYVAGSIGFAFRHSVWENGYYGDQKVYQSASPLYLDAHIGTEYHINSKLGLSLDISTGVSTIGLAIHL
jgi:hypothetical protein